MARSVAEAWACPVAIEVARFGVVMAARDGTRTGGTALEAPGAGVEDGRRTLMPIRPPSPSLVAALLASVVAAVVAAAACSAGGTVAPSDSGASSAADVPSAPGASSATEARESPPATPSGRCCSAPASVLVYLVEGSPIDCVASRAVERTVTTRTPVSAMRALLAGPTAAERSLGYSSWFSPATADALVAITVTDGVARVSLRDLRPIIPNASSSCGSSALLSALDATLRQFPEIHATRYSFLGDEAAFYEWLQRQPPPGG